MLGQSAYAAAGPTIKATKVLQRCSGIYMYVLNLKAGWFEEGSKSRFTINLLAQPIAQPISEFGALVFVAKADDVSEGETKIVSVSR